MAREASGEASPGVQDSLWEAMLDQMVEPAMFVDMAGLLVRCNTAARRLIPWLHPGM
ncbi:MAG: hypothetical protein JWM80_5649, partial [Cyanobacteria bacterium RYN_339]|nr:hypothetical protein [Cyanobacteria bacterium RYN_339]